MEQVQLDLVTTDSVYPPSEDTFMLTEAINLNENDSFIEIGCGCGYVALTAATIVKGVVAVDVSAAAVRVTQQNAKRNNLAHRMDIIQSDLLSAIRPDELFSVIAFNPPYLPADDDTTQLDRALIGGRRGIELTEQFVMQAQKHLRRGGTIYLVVSSLGDMKQLQRTIEKSGLTIRLAKKQSFFYEKIQVLELTKPYTRKSFYESKNDDE